MGCDEEEKEDLWDLLENMMLQIPENATLWIGVDFNGHVGEEYSGAQEVMGSMV